MIGLVGESVLDRTSWPDGRVEERLGGAPKFAATAVAGVWPAVVLTHGGTERLRRPLHELGLRIVERDTLCLTVFEVNLYGDGTWDESIVELGQPFSEHDVETWMAAALAQCSALVLGSQWRDDFPAGTVAALAAGRTRIFFDGQGLLRPRRLGPVRLEPGFDPLTLRSVDVLKLSEEESTVLFGGLDPAAAAAIGVPIVVVTLAERGAIVYINGEGVAVGVEPVVGLADTVGAGDSFLALMAAATEAGADAVEATHSACNGVAALLRTRLATQTATPRAPVGA